MHCQRHNNESQRYECGDDISQYFEAFHPDRIVPANGMKSTPETVCQVKPKGNESGNVNDHHPHLRKYLFYQDGTVVTCAFHHEKFLELHIIPKLVKMQDKEKQDEKPQHKHVL